MQFGQLKRRDFIAVVGSAAAWPLAARAQSSRKLRTIGFLVSGAPSSHGPWFAALAERLRQLGWIEDRDIKIEYRWAEGRPELYTEFAAEFVRLNVDVIVALGAGPVLAAKQATSVIPIVFPASGDPVSTGLVQSLKRPGGNVTGLSLQQSELGSKRLELLRELIPNLRRLGVIANLSNPVNQLEVGEIEGTAQVMKLETVRFDIRRAEDIAPALDALKGRADALYVIADPLLNTNRVRISTLAIAARLPTMFSFRENVEAGGLMSYGPNWLDLFRRAAELVDKILRGANPANIPVEQPTNFHLVINLTTAKVLGLDLSPGLLARANEVIE
jgi:putative tryptophan/tyrosine transport system substrate-binding protein